MALRLTAFHVGFLSRLSKEGPRGLDAFSGRPSAWLRVSIRSHVQRVLRMQCWPDFFSAVNVPLPSRAYMCEWMQRAILNSERKGCVS